MKGINGQTETRLCELKDNGDLGGFTYYSLYTARLRKTLLQKVCRAGARTSHTHSNRQQDSHSCALPRSRILRIHVFYAKREPPLYDFVNLAG